MKLRTMAYQMSAIGCVEENNGEKGMPSVKKMSFVFGLKYLVITSSASLLFAAPAFSQGINDGVLKVCVESEGSPSYEFGFALATRMFQEIRDGQIQIAPPVQTRSQVDTLRRIARGDCDVGVVRSDILSSQDWLHERHSELEEAQFKIVNDDQPVHSDRGEGGLGPHELYRVHAKLICSRAMNISGTAERKLVGLNDIEDLKEATQQLEEAIEDQQARIYELG
ncbi:MAG: hypothetical protein AAF202_12195, partial [Pseudomonadota bacterium]